MEFSAALAVQERLVAEIVAGAGPETLLLLEHPPVYTIGSGGSGSNLLDPAIEAVRVNRGGDVTFHGPGQLVGYPLLRLGERSHDLHRYLRLLEELLILTVADFGVSARRVPGRTGIWTVNGKLAAIGVGVRRWVTMHGFALNVDVDLNPFSRINPCGMVGCPVTSLARECGAEVPLAEVKKRIGERFGVVLEEWLPLEKFIHGRNGLSVPIQGK